MTFERNVRKKHGAGQWGGARNWMWGKFFQSISVTKGSDSFQVICSDSGINFLTQIW